MLTHLAASLALLLALAGQDAGLLRVRVVLMDASGVATPIPRLVLLVSDDPPTDEPRRVRTTADGTIELKLAPGSYVVELDEPVAFRGKAYTWTQTVKVAAGRDTVLDLTAANAEAAAGARINADSATLLTTWRDSVVEIWTPTTHASGFVIDAAKGLIATSHHALANAASVEVQFTSGKERFKVPGQVVVSERDPGAAVVRVDPETVSRVRAVDLGCAAASWQTVNYKDVINTITASMLAGKEVSDGLVTRTTSQAIFSDMRVGSDSEGGPVFAESGALLGISAIDDDKDNRSRWNEVWVVPAERACGVIATAIKKIADVAPPVGTRLPLEPTTPAVQLARGGPTPAAPTVTAANFDITLLTPAQVNDNSKGQSGLRGDAGNWSQYVRDVGQVLLVRISPQFEESVLKMLARGAAATQGMAIPPLKSFTANFLRLRAYCGDAEVVPIHPFVIEHEVSGRSPIREGLYVFERDAFGPHCPAVRFSMFSEKDPQRPDTKSIDPKLFDQLPKP
jgi:S1-C subfamily serine protease